MRIGWVIWLCSCCVLSLWGQVCNFTPRGSPGFCDFLVYGHHQQQGGWDPVSVAIAWELSPSIFISGQSWDDGPLAGDGSMRKKAFIFQKTKNTSTLNGMCLSVFQTEDSYVRSNMYRNEEISSIVSPRSPRSNTGLQRSEPLGEVVMTCILMCYFHPQQCWWDVCLMLYTVLYSWETHCSGLGLSTAIEMVFPCFHHCGSRCTCARMMNRVDLPPWVVVVIVDGRDPEVSAVFEEDWHCSPTTATLQQLREMGISPFFSKCNTLSWNVYYTWHPNGAPCFDYKRPWFLRVFNPQKNKGQIWFQVYLCIDYYMGVSENSGFSPQFIRFW